MAVGLGGILGFGLLMVYDLNSVIWRRKILHSFFSLGSFLIVVSTIVGVSDAGRENGNVKDSLGWFVLAATFLGVLVYTLFFALPFKETYQNGEDSEEKSKVCSHGMYALCRHPGVLWFFFFYLCLSIGMESAKLLGTGMVYSFCNFLYVVFQDRYTFPKVLEGYEEYKKDVPFLIPDKKSIARAVGKAD